jgi:hypothetical protein
VNVEGQQSGSGLYERYLDQQGFHPQVDDAGNVLFRYEDGLFCILIDPDDPQFFHMMYPNFHPLETPQDCVKALVAAERSNAECKVIKISISPKTWQVSASFEQFFGHPTQFQEVFERALRALRNGAGTFAQKMQGSRV